MQQPSPTVLSLTERAAEQARFLLARSTTATEGLRVSISTKGCNGLSYVVEYATEGSKMDELVQDKGVKIFVDPMAIMYILGSVMDYQEDKFHTGFVFNNPNEVARCGCGESFSVG